MGWESRVLLEAVTELSHAFGSAAYVKGGGGNTSCKQADTLWVKPSGTTLAALTPDRFVALDRARLACLYRETPPDGAAAREAWVKERMDAAVRPETPGRASVEAPLHDTLAARFVVHTHPEACNGMTCAVGGEAAAARLFPEALWIPYVDPGYTLCREVRCAVQDYAREHGAEPALIFLQNHGVVVSGDTVEAVRAVYESLMERLSREYAEAHLDGGAHVGPEPAEHEVAGWRQTLSETFGSEAAAVAVSGMLDVGAGPISPDHVVYAKSYPFEGRVTPENLRAFQSVRGYPPRVVVTGSAVLGVGPRESVARVALDLARDGAEVKRLARAFGGLRYLSDAARQFIENWEVESYRAQQM